MITDNTTNITNLFVPAGTTTTITFPEIPIQEDLSEKRKKETKLHIQIKRKDYFRFHNRRK